MRPGGRLIVKEVVDRPRWKYWAIMAQETLSVSLFGITKGDRPHFEAPADLPPGDRRGRFRHGRRAAACNPRTGSATISSSPTKFDDFV
ncbi:MAG: hypothetical protein MZV70_60750 [Desulfobacterales bacterium]|nr:hypothetical protein [Desulfobacterales bacterium]